MLQYFDRYKQTLTFTVAQGFWSVGLYQDDHFSCISAMILTWFIVSETLTEFYNI